MSKQQSKDELMAEFFRMLMADAQQAQKASGPHEEYTMDSFPRYREADHVRKYTVRVALRGIKPPIWRKVIVPSNISLRLFGDLILELMGWMGEHLNQFRVPERRLLLCSGLSAGRGIASALWKD